MATEKQSRADYDKAAQRFAQAESTYQTLTANIARAESELSEAGKKVAALEAEHANELLNDGASSIFDQARKLFRKGIVARIRDASDDHGDAERLLRSLRNAVPGAKKSVADSEEALKEARDAYLSAAANERINAFAETHWKELAIVAGYLSAAGTLEGGDIPCASAFDAGRAIAQVIEQTNIDRFLAERAKHMRHGTAVTRTKLLDDQDRVALNYGSPLSQVIATDPKPVAVDRFAITRRVIDLEHEVRRLEDILRGDVQPAETRTAYESQLNTVRAHLANWQVQLEPAESQAA